MRCLAGMLLVALAGSALADSGYVIRSAPPAPLVMSPPQLPDLAPYTATAVDAKLNAHQTATARLVRMTGHPTLDEFVGRDGRLETWAARQSQHPRAILVEGGAMSLPALARLIGAPHLTEPEPGVFLLRLPLVVGQNAELLVDGSVKEWRLSQDGGAFLVNDGLTVIRNTRLSGWSEARNGPAAFRRPDEFRPFVVSWGGAELYIVGSQVRSLGYAASKSYGVTISQYSPSVDVRLQRPAPTGWILDSQFSDLWFGFYCYEAQDVVIKGNRYRENIVYGIDPHDRSEGLIIAENETSGTRKKHGIIISREVNHSWIFRNRSFDNALSGVMIDRQSTNNVVAFNLAYDNGSDGITIYESPGNLYWRNESFSNAKHGIRVRNSVDVKLYHNKAVANRFTGIYGHSKDLSDADRNLELDPFDPRVSLIVVGGELIHNDGGPLAIDQPLSVELFDVRLLAPVRQLGIDLRGAMGEHQVEILDLLVRQRRAVIIEPDDGAPQEPGQRGARAEEPPADPGKPPARLAATGEQG